MEQYTHLHYAWRHGAAEDFMETVSISRDDVGQFWNIRKARHLGSTTTRTPLEAVVLQRTRIFIMTIGPPVDGVLLGIVERYDQTRGLRPLMTLASYPAVRLSFAVTADCIGTSSDLTCFATACGRSTVGESRTAEPIRDEDHAGRT